MNPLVILIPVLVVAAIVVVGGIRPSARHRRCHRLAQSRDPES